MTYVADILRKAAVVGLAAAALSLSVVGTPASAATTDKAAPAVVKMAKAPKLSAAARARNAVCINAHVQNIGWQGWRCSRNGWPVMVGTTGESLRLEALSIYTRRTRGLCAQAHVQNIGWQQTQCSRNNDTVTVGTVGQSLRMEALRLQAGTRLCAQAHVENIGWQNWRCAWNFRPILVGTVGQSLRLEALRVRV
jgi:uncharacterized protein YjdB